MNGVERRLRIFDAFGVLQIAAGEKILHAAETDRARWLCRCSPAARRRTIGAECAAIFEARLNGAATTAVITDATGIIENVVARRDVDEPHRALPELRRQRAGDQRNGADQFGIEDAAKAGDAVGQHHAVDAELHIGVVVANMKEPACRGILRDAGRLQQHFFDRRIAALRQRLDGVVADGIGGGPSGGEEIAARLIEAGIFGVELIARRDRRRRRRGAARDGTRCRLPQLSPHGELGKLNSARPRLRPLLGGWLNLGRLSLGRLILCWLRLRRLRLCRLRLCR